MKNFEKADIISNVAYKKDKSRFLSVDKQNELNHQMKEKLLRFVNELQQEPYRPESMKLIDAMMNEMHGKRVKDLYKYRKAGNHVVALLCNAIPPEIVYGMDNCQPVTVCMGGGEVEQYADHLTRGMCPVTRSMTGFLMTGMCVFFNVSDYVIASDVCNCIHQTAQNMDKAAKDVDVFTARMKDEQSQNLKLDITGFHQWVEHLKKGEGFNKERLLNYAYIYSRLRELYKNVMELRKAHNPPINGKNSLWAQQLFLVEDPEKLLHAMQKIENELRENLHKGTGYNPDGKKKRVMLVAPRIMPPFTDIYRLVENNNAIIVCEESCMGITNTIYDYEKFAALLRDNEQSIDPAIKYITENMNKNPCACFYDHSMKDIKQKIQDYNVEALILYAFSNCPVMEKKNKTIAAHLQKENIPCMQIKTDYLQLYEQEEELMKKIEKFLVF
ncbi:MAG: 2-hydroxyacyl-CoA dehydratase family protein [Bacteroidales bacterium]